jgi:hypothetical protein
MAGSSAIGAKGKGGRMDGMGFGEMVYIFGLLIISFLIASLERPLKCSAL